MSNVIIFHSPLTSESPPDEMDVLDQAEYFKEGLCELGYKVEIMPFPYDLLKIADIIKQYKPLFGVNLIETLFADGRLVQIGPAILDHYEFNTQVVRPIQFTSHPIRYSPKDC